MQETTATNLQDLEHELTVMKFDTPMEHKILNFWREYEPKKVQDLLSKQLLKVTLTRTANALSDMAEALQQMEKLDPTLARMEAWNRLMKIEEDEDTEAVKWMGTPEEYEEYRQRNG